MIPWTTDQAPLSLGFSWQEYWSRLPFHTPEASSRPRDGTRISCVSCIGRWVIYHCTSWISMCEILCHPFVSSSYLPLIRLLVTISLNLLWKIYATLSERVFRHVDPSLWCQCLCSKSSAPMTLGMSLTPGRQCSGGQFVSQGVSPQEVCSAQRSPAHIVFYPQNTENASLPTTHLPHPQGTWLISCRCWGSISVRTMNSGFNSRERQMRFCVFSFIFMCLDSLCDYFKF